MPPEEPDVDLLGEASVVLVEEASAGPNCCSAGSGGGGTYAVVEVVAPTALGVVVVPEGGVFSGAGSGGVVWLEGVVTGTGGECT